MEITAPADEDGLLPSCKRVGSPRLGCSPDDNAIHGARLYTSICIIQQDPLMSLRSTITAQFEQVAQEQKRKLARLSDDLKLLESGLDSLSFALIVARLEDAVGFDPFDSDEEMRFPVTFGDFVRLYEKHQK
jgi:acyl carrier protein